MLLGLVTYFRCPLQRPCMRPCQGYAFAGACKRRLTCGQIAAMPFTVPATTQAVVRVNAASPHLCWQTYIFWIMESRIEPNLTSTQQVFGATKVFRVHPTPLPAPLQLCHS